MLAVASRSLVLGYSGTCLKQVGDIHLFVALVASRGPLYSPSVWGKVGKARLEPVGLRIILGTTPPVHVSFTAM